MLEAKSQVPMNANLIFREGFSAARAFMALAFLVCGCGKPAPEKAKPAAQSGQSNQNALIVDLELATAAVRILNAAHRNGAVILRGQCGLIFFLNASSVRCIKGQNASSVRNGAGGIVDQYSLHAPVTLEPMDKALQEVPSQAAEHLLARVERRTGCAWWTARQKRRYCG